MRVPRPALAIIPTFLRRPEDLDLLAACLVSLRQTAPNAAVLVLDDGSPERGLVAAVEAACRELGCWFDARPANEGFSRTVNVGLRIAQENGCDAVLVNADVEFHEAGWLERMQARTDTQGRPAAVVGARLLYPNRLLQHAGVMFSLLGRDFYHLFQYGPADLPEALVPCRCPVTAALQLIRLETLEAVGLYDEEFRLSFEDVDYCLRVFDAGLECIYEPSVCALHHESVFRRRDPTPKIRAWTEASARLLWRKWAAADLSQFVPEVV
jgi:GT2 family glycosyltransferase